MEKQDIRIIYIIGAGRSGTTLLDIILGNTSNIFSAGELNRFASLNGNPPLARNKEVEQFWKEVKEGLEKENIKDLDLYKQISREFEFHTSIFNTGFSKKRKQLFNVYADYQKKMFSNIAKLVLQYYNKTIISDSSKYPMRGLLLSKIFGSNISFIYIKRNPQAVVESFQKKDVEQPPKSRLGANIYLLTVNVIANRVIKAVKKKCKVVTITYDDLVRDPLSTLSAIENNLDINLQEAKNLIDTHQPLKVGLLFEGNRLRLKNQITFNKKVQDSRSKKLIDSFFYPLHKQTWYK